MNGRYALLSFNWRNFIGSMLIGAGAFNLLEGLIDHQPLGLHHVKPACPNWLLYDIGYFISGVILIVIGLQLCEVKD